MKRRKILLYGFAIMFIQIALWTSVEVGFCAAGCGCSSGKVVHIWTLLGMLGAGWIGWMIGGTRKWKKKMR